MIFFYDDQPVASTSNSKMNDSRRMEFLDDDEIQSITNSSWLKTSHINMARGLIRAQFPEIGALFNIQCCLNAEYPPAKSKKWLQVISNGVKEKGTHWIAASGGFEDSGDGDAVYDSIGFSAN